MTDQQDKPFEGFTGSSGYEGALQDNQYYNATVSALVVRHITGIQFPGDKVIWTFALDGSTETVEGMTSTATGENSRAAEWLTAMFGSARVDNIKSQPIPRDEIIGQQCMVLVRINDKGYPSVRGVMPRQQPQNAPTPAPAPAAPPAPKQSAADFDDLPF